MRRAVTPLIPQRFKGLDQPFGVIHITRIDLREPGSAFPVSAVTSPAASARA